MMGPENHSQFPGPVLVAAGFLIAAWEPSHEVVNDIHQGDRCTLLGGACNCGCLKDLWWWDCYWRLGVGARDTAKHPSAPHTWGELFQPKASSTPGEKYYSRQLGDAGHLGRKYGIGRYKDCEIPW